MLEFDLVYIIIATIGTAIGSVIALYIHDKYIQKDHAILRNFPVIGRFRYFMEMLGDYMRQYQYTEDWVERPFNRLKRNIIYRVSKGIDANISFGGEEDSTFRIAHSMFPVKTPRLQEQFIGTGPNAYKPRNVFNISGMAFGALSSAAVTALSHGASKSGVWLNTGEGGLSKYHESADCDIIFQIGTAKYSVRDEHGELSDIKLKAMAAKPNVKMFEIKLSQGAKPGKGGILPGVKVTPEIAETRGIPVWEPSISPNSHPEIHDNASLIDFIEHIKEVTQKPVGIKMCIGKEEEFRAMVRSFELRRSWPDFITIDGGEGGTGSAPSSLANFAGLELMDALAVVRETFRGMNPPCKIIASGKCVTPEHAVHALAMGADFITSARGFMFSMGCIQAMQCGSGECPTGVTSANKKLIRGLDSMKKSYRVARYAEKMNEDIHMIANACGHKDASQFTPKDIIEKPQ